MFKCWNTRKTTKVSKQQPLPKCKSQQSERSGASSLRENSPRRKPQRKSFCSVWATPAVPNPRLCRPAPAKTPLVTYKIPREHIVPTHQQYQLPKIDLENAPPAAHVIQKLTDSLKPGQCTAKRQAKIPVRTAKKKLQKRLSKISLHIRIPQPETSTSPEKNELKSPSSKYTNRPNTVLARSEEYKSIQAHQAKRNSKKRLEQAALAKLQQEGFSVSGNATISKKNQLLATPSRVPKQFQNPYIVKRHSLEIDTLKDTYSPEFVSSLFKVASTGVPVSWTINNWEHREDFKPPSVQKCVDSIFEESSSLPQGDFSVPILTGKNLVTCAVLEPYLKPNTSSPYQSVGILGSRLPDGQVKDMGSEAVRKRLAFWRNQTDFSNGNGSSPENSDNVDDFGTTPSEYLAEFLTATMQHRYKEALKYCKIILEYEPNNRTAKDLYPLLKKRSAIEEKEEIPDKEENDHDDSQSDSDKEDSSVSTDESSSPSDDDLDEEGADAPATSSDSRMEESSRFSASHSPNTNGETDSAAYNLSGLDDDDDYKVFEYDDDNGNAVTSNKGYYDANFNPSGVDELDDNQNGSPTNNAQLQEISSPQHYTADNVEKLKKLRAQFVHNK